LNLQNFDADAGLTVLASATSGHFSLSVLTAIFSGEPGLAGFIGAKDDGGGGDSWRYITCKAPVKSSPPTSQHPTFFTGQMPFLSPNHVKVLKGRTITFVSS